MKVVATSKLNSKSGVRWGERGAPVRLPLDGVTTQTPTGLHCVLTQAR
jgi:hypothetical protein